MKIHRIKALSSLFLFGLISSVFASTPVSTVTPPGNLYLGLFGGSGSANQFHISQYGTAFFTEAEGGPLAVNAFGHANDPNTGFYGVQLGYQAPAVFLNPSFPWSLAPAAELEGLYFNNRSYSANLSNNTARLPEHDFVLSFLMRKRVFLANTILNLNFPSCSFHPYLGFGIGGAIVKISGADAAQVGPPEAGINHFNANPDDMAAAFAGQIKAGLSYDINQYLSVFAEYRWLYLSNTNFTFGSTVYPNLHAETSSWQVKLDPQHYGLGAIGIRLSA